MVSSPCSTIPALNPRSSLSSRGTDRARARNTWADWHDLHVLGDSAVGVLSRKHSGMNGEDMLLLCNIESRFEDGRWQVLREQKSLRPLSEA